MAKEERFEKIYSQGALTTTEIWVRFAQKDFLLIFVAWN